jgi:tetratricopeptide (TPR) repeat protein
MLSAASAADSDKAREHYSRGMKAYNLQEWGVALTEFKAAYLEKEDSAFLFNIGQCQRQLGQYEAAAKSYRLYLTQTPDAPNRDQVLTLIEEMKVAAKERLVPAPSSSSGQAPAATASQTEKRAPPPDRRNLRIAGLAIGGVGVGILGAGIAFAASSKQAGDAAYHPSTGVYDPAADDRQKSFRAAEIACFVIGGVAVVAGTTTLIIGRRRDNQSLRASK